MDEVSDAELEKKQSYACIYALCAATLFACVWFLYVLPKLVHEEFKPWEKDDLASYEGAVGILDRMDSSLAPELIEMETFPDARGLSVDEGKLVQTNYGMDMVLSAVNSGKTTYGELVPVFEKIRDKAEENLGDVEMRKQLQSIKEAR